MHDLPVPVVVVGNLSVGGAGKTPLVAALVRELAARGWRPGVVSRGYGGAAGRGDAAPVVVTADADPAVVGDEPLLLARRGVAVAVARDRVAAGHGAARGASAVRRRSSPTTACSTIASAAPSRSSSSTRRGDSATAGCCRPGRCASRRRASLQATAVVHHGAVAGADPWQARQQGTR